MGVSDRNESTEWKRLLLLLGAVAAGTFLLLYVSGGAWPKDAASPEDALTTVIARELLAFLFLLVVPSLWARLIHKTVWASAALVLLTFVLGWVLRGNAADALCLTLLAALPGVGLYVLQRLKLSSFRTVLYGSFLTLFGLFAWACLRDLIRSGDAYLSFRKLIDLHEKALASDGLLETQIGNFTVKDLIAMYRMSAETVCVPLLLAAAMCAGLSNTLFSHLWNRNGGVALPKLKPFAEWRCERWYVLLAAALSIGMMLLSILGVQAANALSSVADIMWRLPCSLAGLCAVRRLSQRAGSGWVFWIVCVATVLLPSFIGILLTLLGMLSSLRTPLNVGEDGKRK